MKTLHSLLFLLLFSPLLWAQTPGWVWANKGGGEDVLDYVDFDYQEVYCLRTDSQRNVYGLSKVTRPNLNLFGMPKTFWGDTNSSYYDIALFSLGCDGSYRWSKIIGGFDKEFNTLLQVDSQDNVYVSYTQGNCGDSDNLIYPPRIDNDWVVSGDDCRLLSLCKYNSQGQLQWVRRPQPQGIPRSNAYYVTANCGMVVDANNNVHWLVTLDTGTGYCDGSVSNPHSRSTLFVLKYDPLGNFLGAVDLDTQITNLSYQYVNFSRNPATGQYVVYIEVDQQSTSNVAFVNGVQLTQSGMYLIGYNAQGQHLWTRGNAIGNYAGVNIRDIDFDAQGNMYICGVINSQGTVVDSFLTLTNNNLNYNATYVAKLNAAADTVLWSQLCSENSPFNTRMSLRGNTLAVSTTVGIAENSPNTVSWGGATASTPTNFNNVDPYFGVFDTTTGQCNRLVRLPSSTQTFDYALGIALDSNNDVLLGGRFIGTLTLANNQSLVNTAGLDLIFVGKYANQPCSLGVETAKAPRIQLFPNPAHGQVSVQNADQYTYRLYRIDGGVLLSGQVHDTQPIDISALAAGCYLIQLTSPQGAKTTLKVVVE